MEAIDVFRRIDALDDRRAADVRGQRQLHQGAVDTLVGVELIDQRKKLRLGSRCRQVVGEGNDADLFAGAPLAAHVNPGGGIIAHLDDGQPRTPGTARQRRCDRAAHLALHLPRQLPAIDELCRHALPSREKRTRILARRLRGACLKASPDCRQGRRCSRGIVVSAPASGRCGLRDSAGAAVHGVPGTIRV